MNDIKLYTIQEVADMLHVDDQTIRRYIKQGKIKAIKMPSRLLRIPESEIEYLLPKLNIKETI